MDEFERAEAHFAANTVGPSALAPQSAAINVYWHVIIGGFVGNIAESLIKEHIQNLNNNFANTGLSFKLVDITRSINVERFDNACPQSSSQTKMKDRLKKRKTAPDLDIYTVSLARCVPPGYILNGYGTFPSNYTKSPKDDGVVLRYDSPPSGQILTHEVGHWVGLYHTFQGGCTGTGDEVADTPAQASPIYDFPASSDGCPGGGLDPIHNFMGYSNCLNEFTSGQVDRLKSQIRTYRSITI